MSALSVEQRFWSHVDKTEGCWLWTAGQTPNGYGRFFPAGNAGVVAHRWSYMQVIGPIPEGLQLDHLCRVRRCVNPAHLEPVTPRVNVLRGDGPPATFAQRTHCSHGHEFTEQNTRMTRKGRVCKQCRNTERKREKANRIAALTNQENEARLERERERSRQRWIRAKASTITPHDRSSK